MIKKEKFAFNVPIPEARATRTYIRDLDAPFNKMNLNRSKRTVRETSTNTADSKF